VRAQRAEERYEKGKGAPIMCMYTQCVREREFKREAAAPYYTHAEQQNALSS
jgi:hypothetical protein